jgi:hypothetical protein
VRPADVPNLDVSAIRAAFLERAAILPPDDRALAGRTLERVQPPNWTLEWHLPWWLGHALGLPAPVARQIVLSNVLGLVSIRLEDDLRDGELPGETTQSARRVSKALFEQAVALYRPLFRPESPFWSDLERFMTEWRSAGPAGADGPPHQDGSRSLARRGAPLKVGAHAVCLLVELPAMIRVVDACLDQALTALALYDDVCDWEADLAAGRWNSFVASITPAPQTPANRSANRSAVLVSMLAGGAASEGFGRVGAEAARAAKIAVGLGSAPLADHLLRVAALAVEQGDAVQSHFQVVADRATALLFGQALQQGVGLLHGSP